MSENPTPTAPEDLPDDPMAGLPEVSQSDIEQAMGVSSVPDEVRTHSTTPDETGEVMDSTGRLTSPADESVGEGEGTPTA